MVVAVVLAALGTWTLTRGGAPSPHASGPSPTGPGPGRSPTAPPRPAFFFGLHSQTPAASGKAGDELASEASIDIWVDLTSFYDTVFLNPSTWKHGVPQTAWTIFDPSVRTRAQADAEAFSLGTNGTTMAELAPTTATLDVKVLLDPGGHPSSAVATVVFEAQGMLQNGQPVTVTNHETLLLRLEGDQWQVFGYPAATTDVESPPPTPSPSPSGSASPTASPTQTPTGSATP